MARRRNKSDIGLFGVLFLASLGWFAVPLIILATLWDSRKYSRRVFAILTCAIVCGAICISVFLHFKHGKKIDNNEVLLIIFIPWIWLIFRALINWQYPLPESVVFDENDSDRFYNSAAWKQVRYEVLRKYGPTCMLCGSTKGPAHVDHVKPRSKYPDLALEISNLQVLCKSCNLGKSNIYEDDFR